MRWSLVLTVFVSLSTFLFDNCLALSIPSSLRSYGLSNDHLVTRGRGTVAGPSNQPAVPKAPRTAIAKSSKTVREAAKQHKWLYTKDPNDNNSLIRIPSPGTQSVQGRQADHILEVQLVGKHLQRNAVTWGNLPVHVQNAVKEIINGQANLAPIEANTNNLKGKAIKAGTNDKKTGVTSPRVFSYMKLSFGTAKMIADKIDNLYSKEIKTIIDSKGGNWKTLRQFLIETVAQATVITQAEWEEFTTSSDSELSGSESDTQSGSSSSRSSSRIPGATRPGTPNSDSNVLGSSPSDRGRSRTRPSPQGSPGSPQQGQQGKRRIVAHTASSSNKVLKFGSKSRSRSRSRSGSRSSSPSPSRGGK